MASSRYVYAIVGGTASLPGDLTGLQDEHLAKVPWRALAAVTSTIAESRVGPDAPLLMRHAAVVEAICQLMPALPVRFGTILPNAAAVMQSLEQHYDTLLADLRRIGDKQEMGVTVLWESAEQHTDTNHEHIEQTENRADHSAGEESRGTRYLLARREAYRHDQAARERAQAIAAELDARVGPHVHASRYTIRTAPYVGLHAAYLLDRDAFIGASNVLAAYQDSHGALRLLITGPWPPYSFVNSPNGPVERQTSGR